MNNIFITKDALFLNVVVLFLQGLSACLNKKTTFSPVPIWSVCCAVMV